MTGKIERISESYSLGEAPHWDAATQSLYYVDIFGQSIHKYVPATNKHYSAIIGTNNVSFIIPIENTTDRFLIGYGPEIAQITWDGVSNKVSKIEKWAKPVLKSGLKGNRFNDGKADPNGKLWAGDMGVESDDGKIAQNAGCLYSLEPNKELKNHISNVHISNGLAWNLQLKKFYYIDSGNNSIDQFDYDVKSNTLSNRKTVFSPSKHNILGMPDGQAIDTDGNLWVAMFGGHCLIKIDPRKPETLLETIKLPAKQVTSIAFGGQNLDEMYVTTARLKMDEIELLPPDHGSLYRITGYGVKGFDGVKVKLL